MKAAQINAYGDASAVRLVDIATPKVGDGQVLVEVYASSINPFDSAVRAGHVQAMLPLELPVTLGGDIAGTVIGVGQGVTNVVEGDMVYGQANAVAGNSGAFAEYALTSAHEVARLPNNVDFKEAASLPLVGVSALQAITEHLDVQPNQKLFINGGAGGIGLIAIQIAKNIGAYVATTATGEGLQAVRDAGADEVIDYKDQTAQAMPSEYDAVFDLVGGESFDASLRTLKRGGKAVSMIASPDEGLEAELGVILMSQQTRVTTEWLDELTKLVEAGIVTPHLDQVFALDDIVEAFEAKEDGSVVGKIVIGTHQ